MSTAYEREREARIASNKAKMAECGIQDAVQAVLATAPAPRPKAAKRKADAVGDGDYRGRAPLAAPGEIRRSGRPRTEINWAVVLGETERSGPRPEPVDWASRVKSLQLDAAAAEQLRAEFEAKRAASRGAGGDRPRGPKDSGKGVRVQGGRVYDSTFGVTCHWCRQKTLEAHVTCTHPKCAMTRMPYSFCHKCLKNRHGEDAEAAAASGCWVCPSCRGSCGRGCVTCCNCGPCRKKACLEPTSQIVGLARTAGFTNVHDYLVHLVTGEDEATIAERKVKATWGAFLRDGEPPSDASADTAAAGAAAAEDVDRGAAAEDGQEEGGGSEAADEDSKGSGDLESAEEPLAVTAAAGPQQVETEVAAAVEAPARAVKGGKGGKKAAPGGKGTTGKAKRTAAAAAAKKLEQRASADPPTAPRGLRSSPPVDAVASGDQDAKSSRKARMMARMGLTPRTSA